MKNQQSEKTVRDQQIIVRVSPQEKQQAQQFATEKGAKISVLIRDLFTNKSN